jgi:hypothetical protein
MYLSIGWSFFLSEGLFEPLRGWVNALKPGSLQETITRTRDMERAVPKNKFPPKPFIPRKNKDKKPFQKEWIGKDRLANDDQTLEGTKEKEAMF